MVASSFEQCVAIVVGWEGGYSNNPRDSGNWTSGRCGEGTCRGTKWGISAAAYPDEPIAALTVDDAKSLYKRDYWDRINGDLLAPSLALLVFDAAVMSGPRTAVRWLQLTVNARPGDGMVGPVTIAAIEDMAAATSGANVCAEFLTTRLYAMTRMAGWPAFGHGWSRRLCRLPYQSMTVVSGQESVVRSKEGASPTCAPSS